MSRLNKIYRLSMAGLLTFVFLFTTAFASIAGTGSISLTMINGNITFNVYQIGTLAVVNSQWKLTKNTDFDGISFSMNDLSEMNGINEKRAKAIEIAEYIEANPGIPVYQTKTSDSNGKVTFDTIDEGIYLIVKSDATAQNVLMDPFFVTMPTQSSDNTQYVWDIKAEPKSEVNTLPFEFELTKKLLDPITGEEKPVDYKYTFYVTLESGDADGVVFPTSVHNDQSGNTSDSIKFKDIEFKKAGEYIFKITEAIEYHPVTNEPIAGSDPGTICVKVKVEADGKHTLKITEGPLFSKIYASAADEIHNDKDSNKQSTTFVNFPSGSTPQPDVQELVIEAEKTLVGGTLRADAFSFEVKQLASTNGKTILATPITAKNDGSGKIVFPVLNFDQVGTYIFELSEVVDAANTGVIYDTTKYYIKVEVTEARIGGLHIESSCGTSYTYDQTNQTYVLDGEIDLTTSKPQFYNTARGYVNIKKISATGDKSLAGAEFTLSYRIVGSDDAWTLHGTTLVTAGEEGMISTQLPDNYWLYEYQLIETKAPSGYSKSRVGTIQFNMNQDGTIKDFSHTDGTDGYVEVSADRTTIIAKNHSTGGSSGGDNPGTPGTPTPPTTPPKPGGSGGSGGSDDPTDLRVIEDGNSPLGQLVDLIDETVPLAGLAKLGDFGVSNITLLFVMLMAVGGISTLVFKRKRKN